MKVEVYTVFMRQTKAKKVPPHPTVSKVNEEFFDYVYSNCDFGLTKYIDEMGHELRHCLSQPTILDTQNGQVRQ